MDTTRLLSELAALTEIITDPLPTPMHWAQRPLATLVPSNEAELTEVVRTIEAANVALIPVGGGTHWTAGYPPHTDRAYILLSTRRLNRILDHQPDDMTLTCQPGVTLSDVQAQLATRRQFLPLDVPFPDRATLGGIVATNRSGFRRLVYGAPRDLVIGLRAVMHGGEQVKGGGKVVKNVAGYDICKLFTGSWGSIGVISEITFKVYPLPESERLLYIPATDITQAAQAGLALHHAQLAPTALLATNEAPITSISTSVQNSVQNSSSNSIPISDRTENTYGTGLLVLLSGPEVRLDWQTAEIARMVAGMGLPSPTAIPVDRLNILRDGMACEAESDGSTVAVLGGRIACRLTDVGALVAMLQVLPATRITVDSGMGVIHFATDQPDETFVRTLTGNLPDSANLFWYRVGSALTSRPDIGALNLWGTTREASLLQRAIKRSLDPNTTFSPGRFTDKI